MKKNKGFTVVELIVSFALTMVITVFLFEVLIEVKDIFADTGAKTAVQQKTSIISKNINQYFFDYGNNVTCTSATCQINGITLKIDKNNNKIVINNQNFIMPEKVNIKSYELNNECAGNDCYLYMKLVLDGGNLKNKYNYAITYYYSS